MADEATPKHEEVPFKHRQEDSKLSAIAEDKLNGDTISNNANDKKDINTVNNKESSIKSNIPYYDNPRYTHEEFMRDRKDQSYISKPNMDRLIDNKDNTYLLNDIMSQKYEEGLVEGMYLSPAEFITQEEERPEDVPVVHRDDIERVLGDNDLEHYKKELAKENDEREKNVVLEDDNNKDKSSEADKNREKEIDSKIDVYNNTTNTNTQDKPKGSRGRPAKSKTQKVIEKRPASQRLSAKRTKEYKNSYDNENHENNKQNKNILGDTENLTNNKNHKGENKHNDKNDDNDEAVLSKRQEPNAGSISENNPGDSGKRSRTLVKGVKKARERLFK